MTQRPPDISFTVPIVPVGKGRPIVTRMGSFTPSKTRNAEQAVRDCWQDAGAAQFEDGPIVLHVRAYFARPKGHFTPKGAFTKKAEREPYPMCHPDWDNIGKLVSDSLNKFAYRDDRMIVRAYVEKLWADDYPKIDVALYGLSGVTLRVAS